MADNEPEQKPQQEALLDDEFSLQSQQAAPGAAMTRKEPAAKQPSGQRKDPNQAAEVLSYRHGDKRTNNPHVGMVDTHSDGVEGKTGSTSNLIQPDLFHALFENLPLLDTVDFYKHKHNWSNRMITGDTLLVTSS